MTGTTLLSGLKIAYARVSTSDQNLDLQMDALIKAGVSKEYIFSEHISGVKANRPEFQNCLKFLRRGDALVVWRLDRLSRSVKELYTIADLLQERGVELYSIMDSFDTNSAMGRAMFGMIGVMAELERNLISERTKAGLDAARKRGKTGGAPRKISVFKIRKAIELKKKHSHAEVCEILSVAKSTLSKSIKRYNDEQEAKAAKKQAKELRDMREAA